MLTRHETASADAKRWRFTRREIVSSLVIGAVALVVQAVAASGLTWTAVWLSLGTVLIAALLIPMAVYAASWLTASSRINHDELIAVGVRLDALERHPLTIPLQPLAALPVPAIEIELNLRVVGASVLVDVHNPGPVDAHFIGLITAISGTSESYHFPLAVKWLNALNTQHMIPAVSTRTLELAERVDDESHTDPIFRLAGPETIASHIHLDHRSATVVLDLRVAPTGGVPGFEDITVEITACPDGDAERVRARETV